MDGAELITRLWACTDRRDWAGLGELLHEDVMLEYPVTGETFRGRTNVVAINAEYPEGWSIRVLRVIADGEDVVSEVEVPMVDVGVFRVASFGRSAPTTWFARGSTGLRWMPKRARPGGGPIGI